jgi:hypothetical protein
VNADGMLIGAGTLSFAGNMKLSGGFPENGYNIVGGTVALVFIASFTKDGYLAKPMKAFAFVCLLAAAMYYVPVLLPTGETKSTKKKVQHG